VWQLYSVLPLLWKPFKVLILSMCCGLGSVFRFLSFGTVSNVTGYFSIFFHSLFVIFIFRHWIYSNKINFNSNLKFINGILVSNMLFAVLSMYIPIMVFGPLDTSWYAIFCT
jgi:hypothetical protein